MSLEISDGPVSGRKEMRIERRDNARGTNLADKTQPVVIVNGNLEGRWTLLCGPRELGFPVNAVDATDEQIEWAFAHDEPVFDV